ncbi:MAG TPA: DUF1049 domain-containing protein [Pararhizobium sp.]|nr:DUF1049 domain-containing protein [Pararhizobium sp.]
MAARIVKIVILVPVAVILIVLTVANRHAVTFALNPFNPSDQVLAATAPFFVFLYVALIIGVIIGSFATWLNQGRYRRRARTGERDAVRWQAEAEKQKQARENTGQDIAPRY